MTVLRTVLIAALFFAGAGTLALEGWLQRIQERDLVGLEAELAQTRDARRQAEDRFDTVVYELLYGPGEAANVASDEAEHGDEDESPRFREDTVDDVVVSVTFAAYVDEPTAEGADAGDGWRHEMALGAEGSP